jgi:hypothetical protein
VTAARRADVVRRDRLGSRPVLDEEVVVSETVEQQNLDEQGATRTFEHGTVSVARLGSVTIGRIRFEPGFRWSNDLKAIVGTDSCMVHHKGYAISGRLHIRMNDGSEFEIGPGDAHEIPAGHDGWVVGDEPFVGIDFSDDIAGFGASA